MKKYSEDEIERWVTIRGNKVPILKGMDEEESIANFFDNLKTDRTKDDEGNIREDILAAINEKDVKKFDVKLRDLKYKEQEEEAREFLSQFKDTGDEMLEECILAINSDAYNAHTDRKTNSYLESHCNCSMCSQAFLIRYLYHKDVKANLMDYRYEFDEDGNILFDKDGKAKRIKGPIGRYLKRYQVEQYGNNYDWSCLCFNKEDIHPVGGWEIRNGWGYKGTKGAKRFVKEQIKYAGEGAAFLITIGWKNGGGHSIVGINRKGKVILIDPQDGENGEIYFDSEFYQIKPNLTFMWRVDKARLNGDCMKYILRGGDDDE